MFGFFGGYPCHYFSPLHEVIIKIIFVILDWRCACDGKCRFGAKLKIELFGFTHYYVDPHFSQPHNILNNNRIKNPLVTQ